MKRGLNILCSLVILILSLSILQTLYFTSHAFIDGFNAGYQSVDISNANHGIVSKGPLDVMKYMQSITVVPNRYDNITDSIYNEVSQSYVPAHFERVMVSIEPENAGLLSAIDGLFEFGIVITAIMAIVWFIKLIIRINGGEIFSWNNVRRLRQLGIILILNFLFHFIPTLIDMILLSNTFAMSNYKLMFSDMFLTINLVLGLLALIVAQVFAMGLRLQEEQELTI